MKNKSLIFKIFLYLIIFSASILILIWLLQIILLNKYYSYYKTNELDKFITKIKQEHNQNKLLETLEDISYNTDFCVEIISNNKTVYSSLQDNKGCIDTNNNTKVFRNKIEFMNSNKEYYKLKIINPKFDNLTLLYGVKLDNNNYVFLNTSLEPIHSTIDILRGQLMVVSIIVILLAIIIAYFITKSINRPITKLTNSAKALSNGNYNINFNVESDIDEIKELGLTLDYAKDVLKKTDELRKDLLSNISHDLKTPLTMIKAYAEMEKDFDTKDKHENNMNIIIEEVDRLTILVNDILNLSKLESKIDTLEKEEFDLTKLIQTILNRFKIFSYTKNYEFIFNYKEELIILADKQKIEQVIYNLVGNAVNYTGDDKKVSINIIPLKKAIRVEITDTGKGIKKEDLNKVWNKYYKTDKKHKRNAIGTGIGLSIVKNIFILHNFKYGIKSEINKGSTFWFEIPKKK